MIRSIAKKLLFVTSNSHKANEVRLFFQTSTNIKIQVVSLPLTEIQGDESIITRAKCQSAAHKILNSHPNLTFDYLIVEDCSLRLQSLNGLPGPYVRIFEERIGAKGIFDMLTGFADKSAEAVCHIGVYRKMDDSIHLSKGQCYGRIVDPRVAAGEFGWDSCFQPHGHDLTFAEMSKDVKNTISHRARALTQVESFIQND